MAAPGEETGRLGPLQLMTEQTLSPRLRRLAAAIVVGREVRVAAGFRARLLGLAHLDRDEAGPGLLIPRCSSVHTFGMRFALDLAFLDRNGRPCSIRRGVPPRRIACDRRADAVLEPAVQLGFEPDLDPPTSSPFLRVGDRQSPGSPGRPLRCRFRRR